MLNAAAVLARQDMGVLAGGTVLLHEHIVDLVGLASYIVTTTIIRSSGFVKQLRFAVGLSHVTHFSKI